MKVEVLRLNHRLFRDQRITSHVFLAARALGADRGFYTGEKDAKMERTIEDVTERWGGNFTVEHRPQWKSTVQQWKKKGKVVHLTMYGLPLEETIKEIRKKTYQSSRAEKLGVIVGGEKVPSEVYHAVDWNVSVTNQPHSEVSGLAVFLYELFQKKLPQKFEGAKLKVVPQEEGKKTVSEEEKREKKK